jgi:hypothetical protein
LNGQIVAMHTAAREENLEGAELHKGQHAN